MSESRARSRILSMAWSLSGKRRSWKSRVRDEQVFGLSAHPVAEIETVCAAGDCRIDGFTDICAASFTVAASSTGDVEGDRDEIAFFEELHVGADLDDLSGPSRGP